MPMKHYWMMTVGIVVLVSGWNVFAGGSLHAPQVAEQKVPDAPVVRATIRVIDGDTVVIDGVHVRIEQIDTPETFKARCANEYRIGILAKERLEQLLKDKDVSYAGSSLDYWGRTLAHVYADGVDVGDVLMKEGHAVRYVQGPKAKKARMKRWCPE